MDIVERLRISRTYVRGPGDIGYDDTGEHDKSDGKPVGYVEDERREAAAEIERLKHDLASWKTRSAENAGRANKAEAERDRYLDVANKNAQTARQAEAQLAEMRAALERLVSWKEPASLCAPELGGMLTAMYHAETVLYHAETVLATDAGKAAADVLAAAVVWGEYAAPPLDGHSDQYRNLYNAVRAYRKEGRDDG